jgi:LmbE family N-acetylglucosaminyl deacetylase
VIVAAHPDDETLAAASVLQRARSCSVVHLTDGAPRDPALRPSVPGVDRAAHADLRRTELLAALHVAGVGRERVRWLGAVDQEACLGLRDLTLRLLAVLQELRPAFVIAHTYEGGHPDHDAACFVAHAGVRLLAQSGEHSPLLYEMTGYHAARGRLLAGEFIPVAGAPEFALALSSREQMCKREMLACFASQSQVFSTLGRDLAVERFRRAPAHDFSRPPHAGATYYEALGWPISAARFCQLASAATRELDPEGLAWD